MNVAVVMERVEAWRGGAETSTLQFAHHLARQGVEVSVLTTTLAPSTPAMKIIPLVTNGRLRSRRTLRFAREAAEYVRAHPFDIVHAITPCQAADVYEPRGGTVPEMLARNRALRQDRLRRGLKGLGQKTNLKYRALAKLEGELLTRKPAPWVIAISGYVARQVKTHYNVEPDRIREVFNGVDPDTSDATEREEHRREIRRQLGVLPQSLLLLCVAHNFKLKGVGRLIEALALVRRGRSAHAGDTYAVIVGRDNPAGFQKLAEAHGVADRVFFTGPTQRIGAFFHACDVLIHPTYYDPCSRVVLEAMSAGLPAITTRFNGASEKIAEGGNGFVIEAPDDVAALADRIERLADDAVRQAFAARAPEAISGATMEEHAAGVLRIYEEIVRSGQPRAGGYR